MDVINKISLQTNTDSKHRIYFVRDDAIHSMTLAELDHKARAVAAHLHALGFDKGDGVGIMSTNRIEWVLLDLAVLKLGGVVAGLEPGRFNISTAIARYRLKWIFVEGETDAGPRVLTINTVRKWANDDDKTHALPEHEGYDSTDICAIKFTSGSTGPPKGMKATVAGINDSLTSVQDIFQHGDTDNLLVFLKLSLLQQRYWIYSALAFGHDVTITSLEHVVRMAQAVHPTVIMGVPGFFEDVKKHLQTEDKTARRDAIQSLFGGRIRYLWTGSAPASRASLDFYNDCGVPLYQGYGLNETCIVAKNYPGANRVGSVGKVLPNKTVRFDERGVLIVGSRNPITRGYSWCSPGDNERMFLPSGEVVTHDLAYLDDDDYLYVLGRVDEIIVLSTGRNILVAPIEERLKDHASIQECVLYGHGKPFLTALVSTAADRATIESHIRATNATLFLEQQVRGLVISPEPFSIENGLLSSQFKPLREKIYAHLANEIERVYEHVSEQALWSGAYGQ